MVKALRASVAKKGKCSTAVAEKEPGAFEGWTALAEFLRRDREELNTECPNWGFQEPIHVISCSETMYGFLAEVKWYTGGSSYVTLPTAVAEKKPGVYLARAKNIRWHYPATLAGLQSIAHLRFLGTRSEIVKMADAKGRDLANEELELLMEMLSVHVG